MSITAERKAALIEEYATKPGDTGSPEVQVAILTERINNLTGHFKVWASAAKLLAGGRSLRLCPPQRFSGPSAHSGGRGVQAHAVRLNKVWHLR